jgi:hypothetical protein
MVDVHMILERADGQVLLAERLSTGYADGLVNAPGGNSRTARTCAPRRSARPARRSA